MYTFLNQYQILLVYLPDSNVSSSMVFRGGKKTKSVIIFLSILSL